jgi:nucleoid DNA-binding protein
MEISDNLLIKLKGSHNNIEELQDFVIVWAEHLAESLNKEEKIELSNLIKFLISKKVFQEYTEPDNLENLRFLSHLYY